MKKKILILSIIGLSFFLFGCQSRLDDCNDGCRRQYWGYDKERIELGNKCFQECVEWNRGVEMENKYERTHQ